MCFLLAFSFHYFHGVDYQEVQTGRVSVGKYTQSNVGVYRSKHIHIHIALLKGVPPP